MGARASARGSARGVVRGKGQQGNAANTRRDQNDVVDVIEEETDNYPAAQDRRNRLQNSSRDKTKVSEGIDNVQPQSNRSNDGSSSPTIHIIIYIMLPRIRPAWIFVTTNCVSLTSSFI